MGENGGGVPLWLVGYVYSNQITEGLVKEAFQTLLNVILSDLKHLPEKIFPHLLANCFCPTYRQRSGPLRGQAPVWGSSLIDGL